MISLIEFVSICGVATMTAAGASQGLRLLLRSHADQSNAYHQPSQKEGAGRPAPGAWHEPRLGKRRAVSCRIEYVVENARYQGMLVDMSRGGWRAQGVSCLPKGTAMQVLIICSDAAHCIPIEEAVVRWSDGLEFGVEVTRISPDSAERLSDHLSSRYPPEVQAPAYALSPFSYN
jgi:PilZ domain